MQLQARVEEGGCSWIIEESLWVSWCLREALVNSVVQFVGPPPHSIFLLFPFGAGAILGVYVTVRVMTSRMCFTPVLDCFAGCFFIANFLAFKAFSQSKLVCDLALNGDLALTGESKLEPAGEGGILRLGKH